MMAEEVLVSKAWVFFARLHPSLFVPSPNCLVANPNVN
jgi:hypothetical protein